MNTLEAMFVSYKLHISLSFEELIREKLLLLSVHSKERFDMVQTLRLLWIDY
jgi:hypothetical protein